MDSDQGSQQPQQPPGKYRSSCDACQSSKVRCSQEKPSCRRCITQGLECVYSLSRRMGRPRQKNRDPPAARETTEAPETSTESTSTTASGTSIIAPATAMGRGTSTYKEDVVAGAHNVHGFDDSSGQSVVAGDRDNTVRSPSMHNNDGPDATLTANFMEDMDLDDILASDLLNFTSFRSSQVPPLSIDCAGTEMNLDAGFTQFSDNNTLLGFHTSDVNPGSGSMLSLEPNIGFDSSAMPMIPGTPLSPVDSALGTTGAAKESAKPRTINYNRISTLAWSECACYSNVLRLAGSSEALQHNPMAITMDSILSLEEDTKNVLSGLLTCPSCVRDPCVQLMAIASFSTTLKLLRHAANNKLKGPSQRRLSTHIPNQPSGTTVQECTLYVGKFKVADDMRSGFIRHIFSVRMAQLLAQLGGMFSNLRSLPRGAMCNAAIMVASQMYNELQTIIGMVELWN